MPDDLVLQTGSRLFPGQPIALQVIELLEDPSRLPVGACVPLAQNLGDDAGIDFIIFESAFVPRLTPFGHIVALHHEKLCLTIAAASRTGNGFIIMTGRFHAY